ncbi:response regulator [Qipengyuania nanhaisediminis]|uniref:response regulator n=1 Tax=Qipengyuania nanhaisediminis TaxID=604088 RepID=UPI0038B3BDA6
MNENLTVLILEDEPLILLDLEFAGEDRDCRIVSTRNCSDALARLSEDIDFDVAILDVSLGKGETCVPVARELTNQGIPFLLHTGDLNRHQERVRNLNAPIVPKPAASDAVIAAAIALCKDGDKGDDRMRYAAG